ncbi:hypothetical protein OB919_12385 [Halobacteria archaeon AArc-curdl1]|uniref:Chromosome segregation protein SMC n=1 Tax=Natronosalvus hydrolyticus TaxID=2979988 RepID=A0AAP2Z9D5_9EURY|nr:hypothetical protein [Halobacteria archaeon AArc-curdl1]
MSKNRVERLEATVKELESTVEGLTEELVESKERIRVLEAELDAEVPTRVPERRSSAVIHGESDDKTPEAAQNDVDEAAAEAEDDADLEDEPEDSGTDDIIVA